ncbi:MAG: ATP-binding protein, partial [Planctomycetota bacterium]|nr:ATP-binding protein [Planctomycetota bacterium]
MAKDLPINSRIVEILAKAVVKNMLDGIVEIVTNSDDSYKRLEDEGSNVNGEISIEVSRAKGGRCTKLIVKDNAEGMTKEELEKAIEFAGETSGYKSVKTVRGLFGRGLKETIIALGEGKIKTVKNGKESQTKLWFDRKLKKPQYDDELLNNVVTTGDKNGTTIEINITNEKIKIPEYDGFKEQISNHYALRDINSSSKRNVFLTFKDNKRERKIGPSQITFIPPTGTIKVQKEVTLTEYKDNLKIIIYESPVELETCRYNPYGLAGILIKTEGATLDNQLFKFDTDPAGLYFFGEAICYGLAERLREGETEIIDIARAGLEWNHEYCQCLMNTIEQVLE